MAKPESGEVTCLLLAWSGGDRAALDRLLPLVYSELRRLAAGYLKRERRDHTLQPSALVHEAYLRLVDQSRVECGSRAQFFAVAANLMRQVLVNHAKRHKSARRGGGYNVSIEGAVVLTPELDLVALNQALTKLAELDPRQCRIVEMRFFAGMTEQEIADIIDVSAITVKREWRAAKLFLHNELRGAPLH